MKIIIYIACNASMKIKDDLSRKDNIALDWQESSSVNQETLFLFGKKYTTKAVGVSIS